MNKRNGIHGDESPESCMGIEIAHCVFGTDVEYLETWTLCGEIPLAFKSRSGRKYYKNKDIKTAIYGGSIDAKE